MYDGVSQPQPMPQTSMSAVMPELEEESVTVESAAPRGVLCSHAVVPATCPPARRILGRVSGSFPPTVAQK